MKRTTYLFTFLYSIGLISLASSAASVARVVLSSQDRSNLALSNVIGREITFPNGKIVREFLGIPYAKPPIRDLRFRFVLISQLKRAI